MGIKRTVYTTVVCDTCNEKTLSWVSTGTGVSKVCATYFARKEGMTVGKKGVMCKGCRIAERRKKCSLIKRLGEPGREADGTCRGFGTENDDEPIEQCKRCIACVDFDWEEEKARFNF